GRPQSRPTPPRHPAPRLSGALEGFKGLALWHGICVKNGVFVNISDVPANPRDYCQHCTPTALALQLDGMPTAQSLRKHCTGLHTHCKTPAFRLHNHGITPKSTA